MHIRLATPLTLLALAAASFSAHADVVALWDYNNGSTKHTQSANGAKFSTVGGVTTALVSGLGAGQALNTTTYAGQGTGNLTRGVQYMIDTTGYTDLVLSFAQRNSSTASAWTTLLYTIDGGSAWTALTSFQNNSTNFITGVGYDFSALDGVNNNELFGIRLLASFAPNTNAYQATSGSYGTGGTIRYDNVMLSGTAIPEVEPEPLPEPASWALSLAGLGAIGLVARRRRA